MSQRAKPEIVATHIGRGLMRIDVYDEPTRAAAVLTKQQAIGLSKALVGGGVWSSSIADALPSPPLSKPRKKCNTKTI